MTKCVGVRVASGEFTDRETNKTISFNNVVLQLVTSDLIDDQLVGDEVSTLKLKREQYDLFAGGRPLRELIGKEIRLDYAIRNGKPVLQGLEIL